MTSPGQRAADATAYWMELVHGAYAQSTIETVLGATETYSMFTNGVPDCTALAPYILEPAMHASVTAAAELVNRAVLTAANRLLNDAALRRAIGFPSYLDAVLEIDRATSRPSIRARLDGLVDRTGAIQFIEYNAKPSGFRGGVETSLMMSRAPIAKEFARRFPFAIVDARAFVVDALVAETRERGRSLPPGVAVLDRSPFISSPSSLWAPYAASRGCRVAVVGPERLEVRTDAVFVDGERVDIVVISPEDFLAPTAALEPLIGALRRGIVSTMYGVSQALLCSNKVTFELLSDPDHAALFDHETQRQLRRYVPWTRSMRERKTMYKGQRIDLLPFLAQYRERFVLKPAGASNAEGVVLGWNTDRAGWEAAIAEATVRPFVVQERVQQAPHMFPMLVDGKLVDEERTPDLCPFVWHAGRAGGYIVRIGVGVHNRARGGSHAALFVLE